MPPSEMDTFLVAQLCHQILGRMNPDGREWRPTPGVHDATGAKVQIEIQGMVSNICRQVWIDQGAIAQAVTEKVKELAGQIDLQDLIRKKVQNEIDRTLNRLDDIVKDAVTSLVKSEVRERLGKMPEYLAAALAEKVYGEAYEQLYPGTAPTPRKKRSKR